MERFRKAGDDFVALGGTQLDFNVTIGIAGDIQPILRPRTPAAGQTGLRYAREIGGELWLLGTSSLLNAEDSPRTRHACAAFFQRFVHEVFSRQPDLAADAQGRAHALGGANLAANGGPLFHLLARIVGCHHAIRAWRYCTTASTMSVR